MVVSTLILVYLCLFYLSSAYGTATQSSEGIARVLRGDLVGCGKHGKSPPTVVSLLFSQVAVVMVVLLLILFCGQLAFLPVAAWVLGSECRE